MVYFFIVNILDFKLNKLISLVFWDTILHFFMKKLFINYYLINYLKNNLWKTKIEDLITGIINIL